MSEEHSFYKKEWLPNPLGYAPKRPFLWLADKVF